MDRRRPTRLAQTLALLTCLAAAMAAPGCISFHGQGDPGYQGALGADGAVRLSISAEYTVPTVIAAGQAVLLRRGYSIVEYRATDGAGRAVGCEPRHGFWRFAAPTVTVAAETHRQRTQISVRVSPVGDPAESRAILDELLAVLGL